MIDRRAFVESLLGKRWQAGASGPDAYSCWGLNQVVQRELFGRELPSIDEHPEKVRDLAQFARNHPARRQWRSTTTPSDGCLVEMSHFSLSPFHMGTWLEDEHGLVLHCQPNAGVTVDNLQTLIAAGWRRVVFSEWIGD